MPIWAYANYAMGPPQVSFSFRVEPPTNWCLFCCMLSTFRCHAVCHIHQWGLNHWDVHHCHLLELTQGRNLSNLVMVISPCQEYTKWLLPPLLQVGGSLLLLSQLSSSHSNYMVWYSALGAWQRVTQSLCLPYMVERGLLFQVWFHL